jgi:hypothetical protein
MEIHNEIASYDLNECHLGYGEDNNLLVIDKDGHEKDKFSLLANRLYVCVTGENGSRQVKIGYGKSSVETFSRIYRPTAREESFRVAGDQGIGIGDLRDGLRITLHYDLSQQCIALHSDGVYLQIDCPGNPAKGDLPWFKETEGN